MSDKFYEVKNPEGTPIAVCFGELDEISSTYPPGTQFREISYQESLTLSEQITEASE